MQPQTLEAIGAMSMNGMLAFRLVLMLVCLARDFEAFALDISLVGRSYTLLSVKIRLGKGVAYKNTKL